MYQIIENESPIQESTTDIESGSVKKQIRGSSLLLVGRVFSLLTNFAVQVLTVNFLTKSDYGAFAYALSLASMGTSLTVFGLDKTITRFVPIYEEKREYGKLFGTIIMMIGSILSIGFFLIFLIFETQTFISSSLINDRLAFSLLLILVFLAPLNALDSLFMGMFAIFSSPRSIFFRKHILGPGLKLLVILLVIFQKSDVFFLSFGYVIASFTGVVLYSGMLVRLFHQLKYFKFLKLKELRFPLREIFRFSVPLLTTDLVYLMRHSLVVVFLEYFGSTLDVAAFRAVVPVARLNLVVIQNFTFLFMPVAARMYAKNNHKGIDYLYWQTTIWITTITFPIFISTFSLAKPLTLLLFGERYETSAVILSILSLGYFFNAALGFNADTLRVYGRVKYIVVIDVAAVIFSLILNLTLIPYFGAVGAAIATCATLVFHNLLNHVGLKLKTSVNLFQMNYLKVYLSIILSAVGMIFIQSYYDLPIYISLPIAAGLSIVILLINRNLLDIENTFPELKKFPIIQKFFSFSHSREFRRRQHAKELIFAKTEKQFYTDFLRENVTRYYPNLDRKTTTILHTKTEPRSISDLYFFDIFDQYQRKSVLIKSIRTKLKSINPGTSKKPRLFPATAQIDMAKLEYEALASIQQHFNNFDPTNIVTIKVLDFLTEKHAILMEVLDLPNLKSFYLNSSRILSKRSSTVLVAFENAGKWLRRFHSMSNTKYVETRDIHYEDFIKNLSILRDYFVNNTNERDFIMSLVMEVSFLANQYLPSNFPIGLGHGDFASRNILTHHHGGVTVIDTYAKWNVPIYEDIGYFLTDIRTSWLQVLSLGLFFSKRRIDECEVAFLKGYFQDNPIPYPQIRLFEMLSLLDKWADSIHNAKTNPRRKLLNPIIFPILALYYKKLLKTVFKSIRTHS